MTWGEFGDHKLEWFAEQHPGVPFPPIRRLGYDETVAVRVGVVERFTNYSKPFAKDLDAEFFPNMELWKYQERPFSIWDKVPQDRDPEGNGIVDVERTALGLCGDTRVFLNFDNMQILYEMRRTDVAKYILDIWIPPADDLLIIGSNLTWMLGIDYCGFMIQASTTRLAIKLEELDYTC